VVLKFLPYAFHYNLSILLSFTKLFKEEAVIPNSTNNLIFVCVGFGMRLNQ